jgi:hypothetical protein
VADLGEGSESIEMVPESPPSISELARERRSLAGREASRVLPSFVTEITQAEVRYTIDPLYLPVSFLDAGKLIRTLHEVYGLTLSSLDLSPLTKSGQGELSSLSELTGEELIARLLREGGAVGFNTGRFPTGPDDFVPIRTISFNYESVFTSVQGVGEIADLLAQSVVEILWACADASKRWEQIEPHVQVKVHGTGTLIDLGFPFERLMNPDLQVFLDANLAAGRGFGAEMSRLLARDDFRGAPEAVLTWALDDFTLRASRFDPRNGEAASSSVVFAVSTRSDYGSGRVLVTSELSSSAHIEFLGQLIASIAG